MKKAAIIIVILGLILVIAGGAVFASAMSKIGWDFTKLSNVEYKDELYSVSTEEVKGIAMEISTTDIHYVQATDDKITIEYYTATTKEGELVRQFFPSVSDGGILTLTEDSRETFALFDFLGKDIVVKVPAEKEIPVSIKVSTGKITFGESEKEIKTPALTLEASTGNIVFAGKVTCAGDVNIKASTGNVKFNSEVTAKNITAETSTGNIVVDAPLKASKVAFSSDTGNIKGNGVVDADDIVVEEHTGNVRLTVKGAREEYSYAYSSSTGRSNVESFDGGAKKIKISTSTGSITLTFGK